MMIDAQAQLVQSHAAISRGELTHARALLSRLVDEPAVNIDAMHALAIVERRLRNPRECRRLFEAVLAARPDEPAAHNNYANFLRDTEEYEEAVRHYRRALSLKPDYLDAMINLGLALRTIGEPAQARDVLQSAATLAPDNARAWHGFGLALRDLDLLDAAAEALDKSLRLAPNNAQALHARARLEADRGRPALSCYMRAARAAPKDPEVAIGLAVSRFEAGDAEEAIGELERLVHENPVAAKAHVALAQLRWQAGQSEDFARSFDRALEQAPHAAELQIAHFATLMRAGRYAAVLERLPAARERIDAVDLFDRYEAVCATECGDVERAERAFERQRSCEDRDLQTAWLRHLLRTQRAAQAAQCAEGLVGERNAMHVWPYLHTAWRLLDDPRWRWLERTDGCVVHFDCADFLPMLKELAQVLRNAHHARVHPFDQSLRNGTQSDGHLLARGEPEIAELRACLEKYIAAYIAQLPPPEPAHPFLGQPRPKFRFKGVYSVLLRANGFHINHMHPDAWISSCFYVDTPDSIGGDRDDPAGWLMIGRPPKELGIDLPATATIRPEPGRLALFPSFLWHGSSPFTHGERLTVVSDLGCVT